MDVTLPLSCGLMRGAFCTGGRSERRSRDRRRGHRRAKVGLRRQDSYQWNNTGESGLERTTWVTVSAPLPAYSVQDSMLTALAALPQPTMSRFDRLPEQTPDAAFALIERYKADSSPIKVDLSPGFYRDENAKPWVLPSVQMVRSGPEPL